ncbi:MAG: hypothetical protein JXR64_10950 [Spirochaetales bacterium]|nr:hypothetical protein [Spirochaetales bacterium]
MDYLFYKFLAPLTSCFLLLSIGITFKYKKNGTAIYLMFYQIFALLFLISNYLEFITSNPLLIVFFSQIQHFFLIAISLSWFAFARNYSGYKEIVTIPMRLVIYLIALFLIIIIFTNQQHHLFWEDINFLEKKGVIKLDPTYGPLFWVISGFDYTFFIAGVVFIIVAFVSGGSLFKHQAKFIISGFVFPLIFNFIYIFKLIPNFNKDYSAIAFGLTGLLLFIGIYRFKLLHFSPVSRNIVLNDLLEGVVTLDSYMAIIDYNEVASRIFNLNETLLGCNVENTDLGKFLGDKLVSFIGDNSISFTKEYNLETFDVRIKTILSATKKNRVYLLSFNDITEQMKLYRELEKANYQLKEIQLQLVQNEKMALLGEVSAGIAHEINNPLSFVKSNFRVLDRYIGKIEELCCDEDSLKSKKLHEFTNELREITQDSNEGINRISDVVTNFLGFSMGKSSSKNTLYNINTGIKSTLLIAKNILNNIEVTTELETVPSFYTTGNEINQVLLNLFTNAAQAIDSKVDGGVIKVKTFFVNNRIICEVSDNGSPIKDKIKEDIFKPFYTTKIETHGTGLGHSLSRNILEKSYNGKLYLKDCVEKVFVIEIPYQNDTVSE